MTTYEYLDGVKYRITEVSLDTIIEPGKNYTLRFEYSNPHNYSLNVLHNNFEAIFRRYLPGTIAGAVHQAAKEMNFSFVYPEHTDTTLRELADQISDYAPSLGINLDFKKAELIEKVKSYWWLWLLLSGVSIGTIIALIKRRK